MRATVLLLLFVCIAGVAAAQQFDPAHRFSVLPTEHFRIYFHEGEEALAARLAPIAEDTWQRLKTPLGKRAPGRTHVILVDQTDLANGWATPFPRDTVAIFAAWPAGSDSLKTDDWLRLVFTHEFTHILHLDRSEGWARVARSLFGRTPIAFPNVFLPTWQVEGLAVYEESAITGQGRLHAGDFRAIVGEAARARKLLPLDRVNGGLTRWPGGDAVYAYGLGFHAYLAERYGADKLGELADRTAHLVPYFGSRAFRDVYAKSLGTLWREYTEAERAAAVASPQETGKRLTHHNYIVSGPRFAAAKCTSCPDEIYYSVRDADQLPSMYRLRLDADSRAERVMTRFLGSTLAAGPERVYFDQQEVRRNAGLYSDLYSLDRATGHVRQLTRDARLIDPDLSPDRVLLAAVQVRTGQRDLVIVRLTSPDALGDVKTLASGSETQFNAPRWSPDGRAIAVERHIRGELPAIVLVDAMSGSVRTIAGDPQTRWATPTWRRDGRAIVAAAAIGDGPFDLYEIDLETLQTRQLTHTTGGAIWPELSPDGSSIVYVGYTVDGFDLFQMPYGSGATVVGAGAVVGAGFSPPDSGRLKPAPTTSKLNARPYSPFPTVLPTWWLPLISSTSKQVGVGALTAGADVLAYHSYSAQFTWWTRTRDLVPGSSGWLDWDVSYVYGRWRPSLFVSTSRETTFPPEPSSDATAEPRPTRRETKVEAGVIVPIVHVRSTQIALVSFLRGANRELSAGADRSLDRAATRAGWSYVSAHEFGNSISPERGLAVGFTGEAVRRSFGSAADATTITGDARGYVPGLARHHVLAVRVAAGGTTGDRLVGRIFTLGGGGANPGVLDFGSGAIGLLRGFKTDAFAGTHAALTNIDYRFPLARVERGWGTWPLFLHTLHAAVFADVGHAWTAAFSTRDLKTSLGAELSANVVLGYFAPLTIVAGAARGHDGSHRVPDRTTWFVRAGYAF